MPAEDGNPAQRRSLAARVIGAIGRRPATTTSATPDWFKLEGMALAGSLMGSLRKGRFRAWFLNEPASAARRQPFVLSDPIDLGIAQHGGCFSDPRYQRFSPLPIQTVSLGPGHVCGTDGAVIRDGAIVKETLSHIPTWSSDACIAEIGAKGRVRFRDNLRFSTQDVPGEHFLGFTGAWRNYSHWMCEVLPRLVVYRAMRIGRPGLKLILPAFAPGSFQADTLSLLGIGAECVHHAVPRRIERFESLYVSFGIDIWDVSRLVAHAAWLLASAHAAKTPEPRMPPRTPTGQKRVYIHRRQDSSRRVANFSDVLPVLAEFGFEVVEFEAATLATQIATMRQASFVIAEHGAGAANAMFCQPGSMLIELFSPACPQPAHWSVASRCGLSYGFLVGAHFAGPKGDATMNWASDYTIDPDRLRSALGGLMKR